MNEVSKPEWMEGFEAKPAKWVPGMKSPNPSGRPKGALSKRDKIAQALNDDGPQVARVIVDAALSGDMTAAGLVLSRILPPVRAQAERVQFDFDPSLPITRQIEQVLAGIASGAVPPDIGQQIISAIGTLSNVRAVEQLEERIIVLEARQI